MQAMIMVKMIFSGKVLGILVCTPFLFVLSELSPQKSSPSGNFRLAGLLRLPLIGAILAQRTALHNTPLTFSPISRKFLHERPGTSGQLYCDFPGSPPCLEQSSSPKGTPVRVPRTESGILHVSSAIFQELHNFMFLSLCTLRIDKSIRNMYNKARNQRSTAEAQERANPADLKQKGARPMVDMEPAQQGQAVGVR